MITMNTKELEELSEKHFIKHQEFLSSHTPEELKQYYEDNEEVKNKLEHCIEDGISYSNKIRIEDFLYLKDLKPKDHINKYLISSLAIHSEQNIILRYLLIEAALNNDRIESILKSINMLSNKKFYNIPNNLYRFNTKPTCYIKEEDRLTTDLLYFKLYEYGILTPEEASKSKIIEKTNKIIDSEIKSILQDFSLSFENEIQAMIELNISKNLTADKFFSGIETALKYFIHSEVENEIHSKYTRFTEGYIFYLNEMYWFDEKVFLSLLKSFFYFPKLLINMTQNTNQVLSAVISYTNEEIPKLKKIIRIHRNQKGKEWRDELYKIAKIEYESTNILDKIKALKLAFEKLPDKEVYRKEFDEKFKSIYEKFIKLV